MGFLFDFLPIIVFFIAFKLFNVYMATAATMAITALQWLWVWMKKGKIEPMLIFSGAVIFILGSLTLLFHNELFIKWKPTIVCWLFAVLFASSEIQWLGNKNLLKHLLQPLLTEQNAHLDDNIWRNLNRLWISFYISMGFINIWIAYHFSTATWVNFKVFGLLGATLMLVLVQSCYVYREIQGKKNGT